MGGDGSSEVPPGGARPQFTAVGCLPDVVQRQLQAALGNPEAQRALSQAAATLLAVIPQGASAFVEVYAGGLVALPGSMPAGAPTDYLIVARVAANVSIKFKVAT